MESAARPGKAAVNAHSFFVPINKQSITKVYFLTVYFNSDVSFPFALAISVQ